MTTPPPAPRRVPPYVALVRIGAVIGMSVTASFGMFLLLAGLWLAGLIGIVLAVPFFLLMRLVEGPAEPPEAPPPS